ncbi:hypothetical protein M413DRAFT_17801 [Hebeloma cylindrosporum]|uniref:Nitronate monooxygenase domain-containing protein n=1 Tax=Hebeloma cylindrosporum TaxID=76867 RepID=A0A0C2YV57_HEBCY|nr:hypothetical protein M413DRAFT_17801 [Hebeloma cylindrosporum h7]
MIPIQTSLTQLLGIQTPIIAAAMAGASGGALASQVALAGGFGFVSAGYDSADFFKKEISIARNALHTAEDQTLRVGVGFLVWLLEKSPSKAEELISIALENRVQAVWLSFGEDIGRWVRYIREHDPRAGSKDAVKIFIQLSTVQELKVAITEWKADVIVVQGNEAGGHGLKSSLPLLTLFPLLANVASQLNGPPLLAAGGLATGSQVASLLTLGASGVVLGTRFLLSPESLYTDPHRKSLLAADSSLSVRTMAFDYARNTLGWPKGVDGRGLRNDTVDDYERGVDVNTVRERFAESARKGENNRSVVWAGSGVGLMSEILPAKDIITELHTECLQHLQSGAQLIAESQSNRL